MKDRISVITVVYNDVQHIRTTIESFFSQTWEDKELVIIDGGSTDGTADIIREYKDRLAYWCSEKDNGIYDAMNKGIAHCTGKWINVLNSGDVYSRNNSLEKMMELTPTTDVDVIYGDSMEIWPDKEQSRPSSAQLSRMKYEPVYRHGSSLVRADIQKKYLYAIDKQNKFSFALDWHAIRRMYIDGCSFHKVSYPIESFLIEGTSNHPLLGQWLNFKVNIEDGFSIGALAFLGQKVLLHYFTHSLVYQWMAAFIKGYMVNDILPHIPFWSVRKVMLRVAGLKIGKGSFVMKNCYMMRPNMINIGCHSHINRGCVLDARGGLTIGENVSISHNVSIFTGTHDINSPNFSAKFRAVTIDDNVWLGANCTILENVHIGKGAVVCAGAVVTKDIAPFAVVGGIPARRIKERRHDLSYICKGYSPLT